MAVINAADDTVCSPDGVAGAVSAALGLNRAAFLGGWFIRYAATADLSRTPLLGREAVISSRKLRHDFGWQPRHSDIEQGMEASALVWRMQDAVNGR